MECIRCGRSFDIAVGECPTCQWSADFVWGATAGYKRGQRIKNYRIVGSLGLGPLSAVIEINDSSSRNSMAMEVIHPALCANDSIGAAFIAGMKSLQGTIHPYLPLVYDVDRDENKIYIVRDFVSGSTLRQLIDQRQKHGEVFEVPQILTLFEQLVSIYSDTDIDVHGSLYPERIWSVSGQLKVVGFGMAAYLPPEVVHYRMTRLNRIRGYVPPELADRGRPDARSDVFALGILLGELAATLWKSGSLKPSDAPFAYRQGLMEIIKVASNPDPRRRYASPVELLAAMNDVMGQSRDDLLDDDPTGVRSSALAQVPRAVNKEESSEQTADLIFVSTKKVAMSEVIKGHRETLSKAADVLLETDVAQTGTLSPPSPAAARRHSPADRSSPSQVGAKVARREDPGTRRYVMQGFEQIAECPSRREITQNVSLSEVCAVELNVDEEGDSATVAIETLEKQLETAKKSSMSRLKSKALGLDGVNPRFLRAAVKIELQKIADITNKVAARIRKRGRRLDGIDPKFIRAAAWLEEAQVKKVIPAEVPDGAHQRADSQPPRSEDSVISFQAPMLADNLSGLVVTQEADSRVREPISSAPSSGDTVRVKRDEL